MRRILREGCGAAGNTVLFKNTTVNAASVWLHRLFGAICHDIYATMTLVVNNPLAIWKHFCSHEPTRQRRLWERLFKSALYKWTYLLTYLLT